MKTRDLLALALRVMGVWLIARCVLLLPSLGMTIRLFDPGFAGAMGPPRAVATTMLLFQGASLVILALLAYVLLRYAEGVAALLAPEGEAVGPLLPAAAWESTLFTVGARLVGLVLLVYYLPATLLGLLSLPFPQLAGVPGAVRHLVDDRVQLIINLVTSVAGAYLLCGAQHLARLVAGKRPAPISPQVAAIEAAEDDTV